ncbi:MAG: cupin domain-containing protein [Chloroflexi bacterium]|nr:cupin domain-containing protein [Chloroflexota bacterium]
MPVFRGWEYPSVTSEPPSVRHLKMIMSPEVNGYQKATVLFTCIPPGGTTGRHIHATSDEIIYLVGRGIGQIGNETATLETDSVVLVPQGVEHEVRNTNDTDTLKLFCVFIPPLGPTPLIQQLIEKTKKHIEKATQDDKPPR